VDPSGEGGARPGGRSRAPQGRGAEEEAVRARTALRAHPCHGCAEREEHARWAERHHRLLRETEALRRRIEGRTNTIARVFDRVCELLRDRGYLIAADAPGADHTSPDGEEDLRVSEAGQALRRIYTESDLLVAECLRRGTWSGLDPAALAACVSTVVYEPRRDEGPGAPPLPRAVRTAWQETVRIWSELTDAEGAHRLAPTREPHAGLAAAVHAWARGRELDNVLSRETELAAGDFVRWCRQLLDLLGQIQTAAAGAGDDALRRSAVQAVAAVRRGVVAYSAP
jgi:ATP-dependent RNA helicase HelY